MLFSSSPAGGKFWGSFFARGLVHGPFFARARCVTFFTAPFSLAFTARFRKRPLRPLFTGPFRPKAYSVLSLLANKKTIRLYPRFLMFFSKSWFEVDQLHIICLLIRLKTDFYKFLAVLKTDQLQLVIFFSYMFENWNKNAKNVEYNRQESIKSNVFF